MAKISKKFILQIVASLLIILLVLLYFSRYLNPKELDDVTPGISCEKELIEKSDVLWIIPIFENQSIADNEEWCDEILALNKTLGMHGVYHVYNEFGQEREGSYIEEGVREFESCFGYKPTLFKAPQLNLSSENKILLENKGFRVEGKVNQVLSKAYHCEDTGKFSNKLIDLF